MNRTDSRWATIIALLLIVPFFLLNFIVSRRIEPFFSWIRSEVHTSTLEYVLLISTLSLFPIAFFIAVRPVLHRWNAYGLWYFASVALAGIILIATIFLWGGLGKDIITCDILKIPNCD